ncbi:MAG: hypothetical protein QNL70_05150 [Pseudomonas sp.]
MTTLPVFLMGICALAGPWLQRWVGEVRGIALGMLLITLASAARFVIDSGAWLIVSAAIAGAGIAMVQALMPLLAGVIRDAMHRCNGRGSAWW